MDFTYNGLLDGGEAWFAAWIETFLPIAAVPVLLVVTVLLATAVGQTSTRRRRIWCALRGREVETEFRTRGLFSRPCAVLACSAFEPSHAVACRRRCLDAAYRDQWPAPLAGRDEVTERGQKR